MKNKVMIFDEMFFFWSNIKFLVELRLCLKIFKFGISSLYKYEGSKNENMLMLEYNYEYIDNSCGVF